MENPRNQLRIRGLKTEKAATSDSCSYNTVGEMRSIVTSLDGFYKRRAISDYTKVTTVGVCPGGSADNEKGWFSSVVKGLGGFLP